MLSTLILLSGLYFSPATPAAIAQTKPQPRTPSTYRSIRDPFAGLTEEERDELLTLALQKLKAEHGFDLDLGEGYRWLAKKREYDIRVFNRAYVDSPFEVAEYVFLSFLGEGKLGHRWQTGWSVSTYIEFEMIQEMCTRGFHRQD